MFTDELMEQEYNKTHNVHNALKILLDSVFDASNKEKANSYKTVPTTQIQQANNIWKSKWV